MGSAGKLKSHDRATEDSIVNRKVRVTGSDLSSIHQLNEGDVRELAGVAIFRDGSVEVVHAKTLRHVRTDRGTWFAELDDGSGEARVVEILLAGSPAFVDLLSHGSSVLLLEE